EQIGQVSEGFEGFLRAQVVAGPGFGLVLVVGIARVLVVVAIQEEQLPVRAVFGVVVVVVVLVMDRQLAESLARELAGTTSVDPGVHLQRLFAITLFALGVGGVGFWGNMVFIFCRIGVLRVSAFTKMEELCGE